MAVTISVTDIALELRLIAAATDTVAAGQTSVLTRLLATASAVVLKYAPDAPDSQHNEAVIRVCGYLFDLAPHESRRIADPLGQSGAAALLAPWRIQRASTGSAATSTGSTPTAPSTPSAGTGEGVDAGAVNALIAAALAAFTPVDATARAAAASAAEDADRAGTAAMQAASAAAGKVDSTQVATAIDARIPAEAVGRIPNPALPAPATATRGHALAQAADGERYIFRAGGESNDGAARASAAANAAKLVGLEAEIDNAQQRIEDLGPDTLTFTDKAILANLSEDVDHSLADSTRVQVAAKIGEYASNADLSGLTWAATVSVNSPAGAVFFAIRVPTAIVRDAGVTGGRLSVTPVAFEPFPFRDFVHHAGDSTYEYFTSIGGVSPVDNENVTAHYEESDLGLAIGAEHLATEVVNRLLTAGETGILETLAKDVVVSPVRSTRVDVAWVATRAVPADLSGLTWANPGQMSSAQGNAHGPFEPALRVPIANIADPAITAGRISIPAFGPANDLLHAIFSNYYSEHSRNSTHVFYVPDGLDVEPLGSGVRSTAEFIENPNRLHIALDHLATAVVARLPTTAQIGRIPTAAQIAKIPSLSFVSTSQTAYDALSNKDANTFYAITS